MSQPEKGLPFGKLAPGKGSSIGRVVAVMSGKGGVGKSSVSALLAVGLKRAGHAVGVLDADITGPSIPRLFGLHERPETSDLGIVPARTSGGIEAMSLNLLLPDEADPVIWRGPLIAGAVKQFWTDVAWGKLDYLVLDLPPGTGDSPLTVMQSIPIDGAIIVTTPQGLAEMVVAKAVRMAGKLSVKVLGKVVNMGHVKCPDCGAKIPLFPAATGAATPKDMEELELLASLPFDPQLVALAEKGRIEDYQAGEVESLAAKVIEKLSSKG